MQKTIKANDIKLNDREERGPKPAIRAAATVSQARRESTSVDATLVIVQPTVPR